MLQKILESLEDLPATPQILPRLQAILKDPNASQQEVVALLRLEGGLTARVIRVANSALFARNGHVENLQEAIGRVGFKDVFRMVCLALSEEILFQQLPAYHLKSGELAQEALACAFIMETLPCFPNSQAERDTRFTVGLFHAVGKIAINNYFIQRGLEVFAEDPREEVTDADERAILGFDHGMAGAEILRHWNFPDRLCDALIGQFDPRAHAPAALPAQLYVAKRAVPLMLEETIPETPTQALDLDPAFYIQAGFEVGALDIALLTAHSAFADVRPLIQVA
jgi:HD-like signal output (HDOD) protein